jgi:hypothetical protein
MSVPKLEQIYTNLSSFPAWNSRLSTVAKGARILGLAVERRVRLPQALGPPELCKQLISAIKEPNAFAY